MPAGCCGPACLLSMKSVLDHQQLAAAQFLRMITDHYHEAARGEFEMLYLHTLQKCGAKFEVECVVLRCVLGINTTNRLTVLH